MTFTEQDEGKTVISDDGRELGVVSRITNETAFVEPLGDLDPPVRSALGWGGDDREEYRLSRGHVATVTGSEVWLEEP